MSSHVDETTNLYVLKYVLLSNFVEFGKSTHVISHTTNYTWRDIHTYICMTFFQLMCV